MLKTPPFLLFLLSVGICLGSSNAFAQIPTVGNPNTLDVGTWNIEWFGSPSEQPSNDALQLSNARQVILESEIDLWGVQEISSTSAFESLLDALGPNYDGQLATNSGTQRIGFIYNTDVIRVRQIRHILESAEFEFAFRPPLQMEVDVLLPDTTVIMTFIVVHMKARADQESYERRTTASTRLKSHIDFTTLGSKPVVVLGDFNDKLERSIFANRTTPYDNFLQDPDKFNFLSYPLEMDGEGTFCSNSACTSTSSFIDHILITDELFDEVDPSDPVGVYVEAADVINAFGSSTSDHLPVYARFNFGTGVVSNQDVEIPDAYSLTSPYPNPFSTQSTFSYTLHSPSSVRLDVYDILGRLVQSEDLGIVMPGAYEHRIRLGSNASGTYFLRVYTGPNVHTYPLYLQKN